MKKVIPIQFQRDDRDDVRLEKLKRLAQQIADFSVFASSASGGSVNSVVEGTGVSVDDTDPANPIVGLTVSVLASLALADSALQPGDNVSRLLNDAGYITAGSLPVGADPTASVGLAAVNGSAATFMRSDAAPALDQSIAPLWTGNHTWVDSAEIRLGDDADLSIYHDGTNSYIDNDTGLLDISSPVAVRFLTTFAQLIGSDPEWYIKDSTGGVDMKTWAVTATNDSLLFRPRSDLDAAGSTALQLTRSGNSVPAVRLPQDNLALQIGAGQDLSLSHDGNKSVIRNDTGLLFFYLNSATQDALFAADTDWALTGVTETPNLIVDRAVKVLRAGTSSAPTFRGYSYGSAGSRSAPAACVNGDGLFSLDGAGYDGSGFGTRAFMRAFAGETWSSTIHGSYWSLGNTAIGGNASRTTTGFWSDGSLRLTLDNAELSVGAGSGTTNNSSGDLRLYHDGTNSFIRNDTGDLLINFGGTDIARFNHTVAGRPFFEVISNYNGTGTALKLTNNNALDGSGPIVSMRTTTTGAGAAADTEMSGILGTMAIHNHATRLGHLDLFASSAGVFKTARLTGTGHFALIADNQELQLGAGTAGVGDLRLYHDGTNSIVRTDTGELILSRSGARSMAVAADESFRVGSRVSALITNIADSAIYATSGSGSGDFGSAGHLFIQPRSSAARDIVFLAGTTSPVEQMRVYGVGASGAVGMSTQFRMTGAISPGALGANTDNWAPTGLATCSVIRASASGAINLTGITAQPAGTCILLMNVGTANNITLTHDATSTAANRFLCPNSASVVLRPNGWVYIWYDTTSSRWRVMGA